MNARTIFVTRDANVIPVFSKDVTANVDYRINWGMWLGGDAIVESTWTGDDGVGVASADHSDTITEVRVSSGILGESYLVTNHIQTDGGRQFDQSFRVYIARS